jgi:hypothetical protein
MEAAVYMAGGALAVFVVTQSILCWVKVAGIEAKLEAKLRDLYHHITELEELHPRRGNPGRPTHQGGEHPHAVDPDGKAT